MSGSPRIAVCGGGTGGHAIPAVSICEKIRKLEPNAKFLYIGAKGSIEERLAHEAGLPFKRVWVSSLRRGRIFANLLLPLKCTVSLAQALVHLSRFKVQVVVGTGGFSAWPACAAARYSWRTYVLWEPNAYPGLVTRLLAKHAERVYLSFEEVAKQLRLEADQYLVTGNPVPMNIGGDDAFEARKAFGLKPEYTTLFVTGGSGGARSINEVIGKSNEKLIKKDLNIIWQTGRHWSGSLDVPEPLQGRLFIKHFFSRAEMSRAYSAADFALTRCGAMTLAELAQVGLPALLVPFPHAAEGHQEANARAVEAAGGGLMILDKDFGTEILLEKLADFLDMEKRKAMSAAMKQLARPDAVEKMAGDILSLIV